MHWIRIRVSNVCNFDCPSCHVFKLGEQYQPYQVMRKDTLHEIVGKLISHVIKQRVKTIRISLYGGEPLANKKAIWSVLEHFGPEFEGVSLEWVINSNGSLLEEDDIPFLKKANVDFHLSIDGPKEIHNRLRPKKHGEKSTFDLAWAAGELLKKHDIRRQINSYVNPTNFDYLYELVDISAKLDIRRIYLDLLYSSDRITTEELFVRYSNLSNYAAQKGIQIGGPWWRVLNSFNGGYERDYDLRRLLALEFNVDGSFYVLPLVKTRKTSRSLADLTAFLTAESLEFVSRDIRDYYASKCAGCTLEKSCKGVAINQVEYHLGLYHDYKYSCDFYRYWIPMLVDGFHLFYAQGVFKFHRKGFGEHNWNEQKFLDLIELFEISYRSVSALSGRGVRKDINVYLVPNNPFLRAQFGENWHSWVRIFAFRPNNIVKADLEFSYQVKHELMHLVLYSNLACDLPVWLEEGICEAANSEFNLKKVASHYYSLLSRRECYSGTQLLSVDKSLFELDPSHITQNMAYAQVAYMTCLLYEELKEQFFIMLFEQTKDFISMSNHALNILYSWQDVSSQ